MRRLPRCAASHLKCFTTLVTYTSERSIPTSIRTSSRSLPAGPTNGWPALSSLSPGCSPTNITRALAGPSPNTVCVPSFQRSHALQVRADCCNFRRVGEGGMSAAALPLSFTSGLARILVRGINDWLSKERLRVVGELSQARTVRVIESLVADGSLQFGSQIYER